MRYRAQLRPSLFIFTGRVTRQQIVFSISLFISSSNSPLDPPRESAASYFVTSRIWTSQLSSGSALCAGLERSQKQLSSSIEENDETRAPAKLHARSSTAIRYLDGGLRLSRAELARRKNREQLAFNYRDAASQKFNQSSRDALK